MPVTQRRYMAEYLLQWLDPLSSPIAPGWRLYSGEVIRTQIGSKYLIMLEVARNWFYQNINRVSVGVTLQAWIDRVEKSGFRAFKAFVKTHQNWKEAILNYFDGRQCNGFAEGVNLKIKMIHRRAFGYRNFEQFLLHILVAFDPVSR